MSQSLSQLYVHIVFSTKKRSPFLKDKKIREELFKYLSGIFDNQSCPALIIGGHDDHVHVLCRQSKNIAIKDLIRAVKAHSSKWIKEKFEECREFHWQEGYGAFSISPSHIDALRNYIKNQEEHHKAESFQDEMRKLFSKYGVEYEERFVWD